MQAEMLAFVPLTPYCGFLHMGGEEIDTIGRGPLQQHGTGWRSISIADPTPPLHLLTRE